MTTGVILSDVMATTSCEMVLIPPLSQTSHQSTERLRTFLRLEPESRSHLPLGGTALARRQRPWLEGDLDLQGSAPRYLNEQMNSGAVSCFEYGLGFLCFPDLVFKYLKHPNAFRFLKKNQCL